MLPDGMAAMTRPGLRRGNIRETADKHEADGREGGQNATPGNAHNTLEHTQTLRTGGPRDGSGPNNTQGETRGTRLRAG